MAGFNWGGPTPMGLSAFVQQQGAMGKQEGEDSRLAQLVSGAMSDPSKRQANIAEIASFRPDAAFKAQDQFDGQQDRQYAELGKVAAVYAKTPEALRPQLWAKMRPQLEQQFGMTGLPDMPTPEIDQMAQQLAQVYGGDKSTELPSDIRSLEYLKAHPELMDINDRYRGTFSFGDVPMPDGTIAQKRQNARTGIMELVLADGRVVPMAGATDGAGGSMPTPQPSPQPAPQPTRTYAFEPPVAGEEADPAANLPPEEQQLAGRLMEAGMSFTVQNGRVVPGGAAPKPGFGPNGTPPPQSAPAANRPLPSINDWGGGPIAPLTGSGRGGMGFGESTADKANAEVDKARRLKAAEMETELAYADRVAEADAKAARLKKEAEAAGERTAQAPKRIAAYRQALTSSASVVDAITKAKGLISPYSTGYVGARLRGTEGTPAYDLAATVETIKANLGFDRLQQMRDNSPTGGALGSVAVQELTALQSTISNLDPNQSEAQILASLEKVERHYQAWAESVNKAIAEEEKGPARPAPPSADGWGMQKL